MAEQKPLSDNNVPVRDELKRIGSDIEKVVPADFFGSIRFCFQNGKRTVIETQETVK